MKASPSIGIHNICAFQAASYTIDTSKSYISINFISKDGRSIPIVVYVEGSNPTLLAGMMAKAINEAQIAFNKTMAEQGG